MTITDTVRFVMICLLLAMAIPPLTPLFLGAAFLVLLSCPALLVLAAVAVVIAYILFSSRKGG